MRIGALRVPSDDCRQYRRAEGLASGVTVKATLMRFSCGSREGFAARASASGRAAGASARRHRRSGRGAAARRPRYMSLCGERAPRAVVTDSQWRRRPTVCPTAGTAARVAPPRCTPPAPPGAMPPSLGPPPPVALHPPRPEEFSASGGKNRLCSEPRIISARRTAPLRPLRRPALPPRAATVKRIAFHSTGDGAVYTILVAAT